MATWVEGVAERREIIRFVHKIRRRGYDDAGMASVSARADGAFFIASAQLSDVRPAPETVALLGLDGGNLGPEIWPGDDAGLHGALYTARSDAGAVIHAQPPFATALAAAGALPNTALTQEILLGLDEVVLAPYQPRRTDQLSASVLEAMGDRGKVVLVRGLGVVALGGTVAEAFRILQLTEMAARLTVITGRIGADNPGLTPAEQRAAWEV